MDNLFSRGQNFCTSSSLLTATGAETVHDTTVLLTYCIRGKAYTKSGTNADQATPTLDAVTGLALPTLTGTTTGGQGMVIVWCYDTSGVVKNIAGSRESLNAAGLFTIYPNFPVIPDTLTPFCYIIAKHYGQATVFTWGTSNWNTSGASQAHVNILVLPDRPQLS